MKITITNGTDKQTVTPDTIKDIKFFPPKEELIPKYYYQVQVQLEDEEDTCYSFIYKIPHHIDKDFTRADMLNAVNNAAASVEVRLDS